jgi:hypothetical protein
MGEPHLSLALHFLFDIYQETAPLSTPRAVSESGEDAL